jgi:mono/diheme cytochrome c family protein
MLPLAQGPASSGDPQAGKSLWEGNTTSCKNCHGLEGQGGFGPDLAGRKLTFEQFKHAVRQPWGVMPTFIDSQVSDKEIADFLAYFNSLPTVAEPAPWRTRVPASPSHGQAVAIATVGCGQCHGVTLDTPRHGAGEVNGDFEWFKHMVYEHTAAMPEHWAAIEEKPTPRVRMGNYNRQRLQESLVQDIWNYMKEVGFLVPVNARLTAGVAGGNGVTYTLNVENTGKPGKGLAADDVTITLVVPKDSTVVSATGTGYQGVRHDDQAKADTAVWHVARVAPKDHQQYAITLSKAATAADNLKGTIRWANQIPKTGPGETVNIPPAPVPRATP